MLDEIYTPWRITQSGKGLVEKYIIWDDNSNIMAYADDDYFIKTAIRYINAHEALAEACSTALAAMVRMGNDLNWPATMPQSYADAINALRAARALANGEDFCG